MNRVQPTEVTPALSSPKSSSTRLTKNKTFSGYNPFQMPPNLDQARIHGQAKRVYLSKKDDNIEEEGREVCVCCGLPVHGKPIPLNAGLEKLYHLGSGYALYFTFIKYCIVLLTLLFVTSGAFNLISNVIQGDCKDHSLEDQEEYCVKGYILSFTLPNKRDNGDLLSAQLALNLVSIVLIMLFFHFFRYQFRKIEVAADDKTVTPADYTIRIDGIPHETKNSEIEEWLKGFATKETPIKIEKITRPFIINEYIELLNKSSRLNRNKEKLRGKDGAFNAKNNEKIEKIDAEVEQITKSLKQCKEDGLKHCSNIYVTFSTAHESIFIQSKFKKPFISNFMQSLISKVTVKEQFQGHNVKVKRAPEPTDIMWENLGYSSKERMKTKIFTVAITALLIIICFAIIILINWGQEKAIEELGEGSLLVQLFSIAASLFIFLTNFLLSFTIDYLAKFEKHLTYTYYLKGVAEKLAIAQFLNTAIASLVAELILATDSEGTQTGLQAINFYGKGGLFENIYWVFITSAFLTPFLTICDPSYFMKLLNQYWAKYKGTNLKMYQKKANTLFEGPPIAMTNKYATMIKIVLLTAFYAPGVPFSMIYTILGLILCYWTEKYTLLRRDSLPNSIDDELADTMLEYLEWAAFTFAVGNIIYVYTLKNSVSDLAFDDGARALVWISLGISLFHIIFPMELVNKRLFPIIDEVTESQTYQQARLEFTTDYDIENPITRKKALQAFIKRLQKKPNNDDPEFLNKLQKGILGKVDAEDLLKMMENKGVVLEENKSKPEEEEDEEIDFDFLDIFAQNVQQEKEEDDENLNEGAKAVTSMKNLDHQYLDETKGALLSKVLKAHNEAAEQEQERGPEPDPEQAEGSSNREK